MTTYKEIAQDFLTRCAHGDSREAFKLYAHKDFKHHNAFFKGDAHTLMVAMEEAHHKNPNKIFRIHHALQDDNMVAFHSFIQQNEKENGYVVMHIFRFFEDKIVEMWDFGQEIPKEMPNENGML